MEYTNWYHGQPDNYGDNEYCVNIWPDKGYAWNDENCEHTYCFVCENRNIE